MKQMSRYMGGTDAACRSSGRSRRTARSTSSRSTRTTRRGRDRATPVQALREYRQKSGINAKLVSVGFTATNSIADPNDAGMMDVVGFDTAAPQLIQAFVEGQV
jgi:60 kDa SS-A/Ro ribonucleoprotein